MQGTLLGQLGHFQQPVSGGELEQEQEVGTERTDSGRVRTWAWARRRSVG